MIFKFVTEQGIVSHLDISYVDIIYKFRLFVTNKKNWKIYFGLLWRYLRDIGYMINWLISFNAVDFLWSICAVIK